MNPFAIFYCLVSLVIICLSVPLMMRKVKRNTWYGIRDSETFKSEERWLEINQYAGVLLLRWGIGLAIISIAGLCLSKRYSILFVFPSLIYILVGFVKLDTLIDRNAAKTKKRSHVPEPINFAQLRMI